MLYHKTYLHKSSLEWVVFVHGAGGSSAIWFKQIRDFAKEFNVLLLDLRGHGKSKDVFLESNYSFKDVSKDVVAVLDHLKIEKAHFVGVSLGSLIVRVIADLAEIRIKTMLMYGAIPRLNFRCQFLMYLSKFFKLFVPFVWLYSLFAYILMPYKRNKEARMMFIKDALAIRQSEFMRWFALTAEVNPLLKKFKENEIPVPTLYLMGDEDYMFLPEVQDLLKIHKYAELHIIPDCGHVCNVEQPVLVNQLSVDFIKKHSN